MADAKTFDAKIYPFCLEWAKKCCPSDRLPPGGRFFHYTTNKGMRGIIQSGQMRAYHINQMNDYAEVRYAASVMRAHLDRRYATDESLEVCDLYRAMRKHMDSISTDDIFVLSFSEVVDEIGMLRLYADRGTGFIFHFPLHLSQSWTGMIVMTKCQYDVSELERFCRESLERVREIYLEDLQDGNQASPEEYAVWFFNHITWFAVSFKSHVWADEREWRLVFKRPKEHHRRDESGRTYVEVPGDGNRFPIEGMCAGFDCDYETNVVPLQKLMLDHGWDIPIHVSRHFKPRPGSRPPRFSLTQDRKQVE